MRNIPIPVDVSRLQFTAVKSARPKVVNRDTGEIKTDKNGKTVYEILLTVEDEYDRVELVKVATSTEPAVNAGDEVTPVELVGYVWEQTTKTGELRWGIAYRASSIVAAAADRA
ncbi:hypothetical protein J5X84_22155 [Streptosporangiaceae bacterium NEAU-GS5]|nr:hypothetical protein [Streptosporangiaceae bacterium NEAU-GS5]